MGLPSHHGNTVYDRIDAVLASTPVRGDEGIEIGTSREGRSIRAFRLGRGRTRISLIGGCHADEPVGPRLLRHLTAYLTSLPANDQLLRRYAWWIVPHVNPDGEARNRSWYGDADAAYDIARYLAHAVRERPGDDIEFGFPRHGGDDGSRPENRAVFDWWCGARDPFRLHVSLHGMGFGAGPWFLIEPAWRDRVASLMERCTREVARLGYTLHDVDRGGEKGFFRLARGFGTRPDSRFMREHFLACDDPETASQFRPSSMEAVRALGGDPLTLVTEMPLFITPGVGRRPGPPDPIAEEWKARVDGWRLWLARPGGVEQVVQDARASGLQPMPVRDQMRLQWRLVTAGLAETER